MVETTQLQSNIALVVNIYKQLMSQQHTGREFSATNQKQK